jgi:hypothetical protein
MKFSLALVLVSLSVLTAAKHEFVRKSNPNPGQKGGNGDPSGSSGPPANVGNPAKPPPAATPSGYLPKMSPKPKPEFVRRSNPNPGQKGGNGDPSDPSETPANVGNPAKPPPAATPSGYVPKTSPKPKHEFVRRSNPNPGQKGGNGDPSGSSGTPVNVGNPAKSQPAATPSSYVPKTGSTSGTSSSGWVQNPTGDASFSARSGCQSPGKS